VLNRLPDPSSYTEAFSMPREGRSYCGAVFMSENNSWNRREIVVCIVWPLYTRSAMATSRCRFAFCWFPSVYVSRETISHAETGERDSQSPAVQFFTIHQATITTQLVLSVIQHTTSSATARCLHKRREVYLYTTASTRQSSSCQSHAWSCAVSEM